MLAFDISRAELGKCPVPRGSNEPCLGRALLGSTLPLVPGLQAWTYQVSGARLPTPHYKRETRLFHLYLWSHSAYEGSVAIQRVLLAVTMLYESTKSLLQSIVESLETDDRARWDDRTESGNACLYEMHQMSRPFYSGYKSDSLSANSAGQNTISEMVNRAMPHVRTMVLAIRHKNQTRAIASGRAALAEMNGASHFRGSGKNRETRKPSTRLRRHEESARKSRPAV
jgi:hypothetical protein